MTDWKPMQKLLVGGFEEATKCLSSEDHWAMCAGRGNDQILGAMPYGWYSNRELSEADTAANDWWVMGAGE